MASTVCPTKRSSEEPTWMGGSRSDGASMRTNPAAAGRERTLNETLAPDLQMQHAVLHSDGRLEYLLSVATGR